METKKANLTAEEMSSFINDYLSMTLQNDEELRKNYENVVEYISKDSLNKSPEIVSKMADIPLSINMNVSNIGATKDFDLIVLAKDNVEIGFRTRKNGKYLMLKFVVVNKGDKELKDAKILIGKNPEIHVFNEKNTVTVAPDGSSVVEYAVSLASPLKSEVKMQFVAPGFEETTVLPITFCDFATEVEINGKDFMKKWNMYTNPENSVSLSLLKFHQANALYPGLIATIFGAYDGINILPNNNAICALHYVTEKDVYGVLIRAFEEFGTVKLQCRCSNKNITEAIKDGINKFCNPIRI